MTSNNFWLFLTYLPTYLRPISSDLEKRYLFNDVRFYQSYLPPQFFLRHVCRILPKFKSTYVHCTVYPDFLEVKPKRQKSGS